MSGSASSLEYLLTSDDFQYQSYLERIELLERISEHDNAVIEDLEEDIVKLQAKVEEIEATKLQKNAKIEDLDIKVIDLEAKKQEQLDARQVIQDAEDEIQADLDKVMSVVNKLNASSKEYEAAIERGEATILDYEHKLSGENSSFGSGTTGNMIWPLPYNNTYVSSSFKMRTLNGVTRQHNGIDICRGSSSHGATIVAVKAGTVTTAYHSGYNGGYGLYVVVDHGDGVKTYAQLPFEDEAIRNLINAAETNAKNHANTEIAKVQKELDDYQASNDSAVGAIDTLAKANKATLDAFFDENAVSDAVVNTLKEI
jgi:peptidoglycan hydrolase CwlO-like protein